MLPPKAKSAVAHEKQQSGSLKGMQLTSNYYAASEVGVSEGCHWKNLLLKREICSTQVYPIQKKQKSSETVKPAG